MRATLPAKAYVIASKSISVEVLDYISSALYGERVYHFLWHNLQSLLSQNINGSEHRDLTSLYNSIPE